jgi:hypothetical protein
VFKAKIMRSIAPILSALALAFAAAVNAAELTLPDAEPVLRFNAKEQRFTAAIESMPLKAAMAKISAATGWKVLLDPAAEASVSAQFINHKPLPG